MYCLISQTKRQLYLMYDVFALIFYFQISCFSFFLYFIFFRVLLPFLQFPLLLIFLFLVLLFLHLLHNSFVFLLLHTILSFLALLLLFLLALRLHILRLLCSLGTCTIVHQGSETVKFLTHLQAAIFFLWLDHSETHRIPAAVPSKTRTFLPIS
jgi:hypothetical protein